MLKKIKITFVITTLLTAFIAHADEAPTRTRKVKVKFTDELVKGISEKPDVDSLNAKKDFNYKKLIRVRENFMNEMEDGYNDFKGH